MPSLVRLYIRHVIFGFLIAFVFVGLLFWFNVANLWYLVTHTSDGPLAAVLLVVFNGIVFSGVQFGIAVMQMAREQDVGGPGSGTTEGSGLSEPVPVYIKR